VLHARTALHCAACCSDLPDGPYLDQLRTLVLSNNKLTRLPATLRRAKQLQVRGQPCLRQAAVALPLLPVSLRIRLPLKLLGVEDVGVGCRHT